MHTGKMQMTRPVNKRAAVQQSATRRERAKRGDNTVGFDDITIMFYDPTKATALEMCSNAKAGQRNERNGGQTQTKTHLRDN